MLRVDEIRCIFIYSTRHSFASLSNARLVCTVVLCFQRGESEIRRGAWKHDDQLAGKIVAITLLLLTVSSAFDDIFEMTPTGTI